MEQMKEYHFEFAKPLLLCFDLLNRCNIGFFNESLSFATKHWRFVYLLPLLIIYYVSTTAYMFGIFVGQVNTSELAFMVSVYLILLQCLLKAVIIIPKKSDISNLVTQLGSTWRSTNLTERQLKKKNSLLKRLHRSHNVFYWGSMIASYQNLMSAFVYTLYQRIVLGQDSELQLPFGSVYPFNPVKNWYIYIFMYIFQTYTMLRVIYFYIGTELLMITLTAQITTAFKLLREDLALISVGTDLHSANDFGQQDDLLTIQEFIRRHQKLIQLSKQLDLIFNRMIFIDLFFAAVITCFFGFGATVAHGLVDKANNYIAVLAMLFPIYVFCYYGDMLKDESAGVAESAYESLWYQGNAQYQKIIIFVIMRSQRPCSLTSLEYTPITLNTFAKVVSTTWSYFSLAISVYSED